MNWQTALAPVLFLSLASLLRAAGPDDQVPAENQQAAEAPKKEEPGQWWEKNAMKVKPFPTRWLFHGEGTISYMNSSGNTSGSTFDSTAVGELRKGRVTSHTLFQLSHRNIVYLGQGVIDYVERTLREQVDYDPTESITLFAAIDDYRNTLIFMDRRLLVYAGVGGRVFRNESSQVVVNGGLGHANFDFDRAQLLRVNPRSIATIDTSPSSGGVVGTQTWRWNVSRRLKFLEEASYVKYFDSGLAYHGTIRLTGDVPLSKRLSFNISYRLKKESNPVIRALGVLPLDRTLLMGIKVSI